LSRYDTSNRLTEVDEPSGTTITFTYDGDGNRVSKTVTSGSTTTVIKDVYAQGHLVEQADSAGTILASFTDDTHGTLTSVVLGNPNSGPRYDYAYDAQGNVVALTDSSGNVVASYTYDAFGSVTATETFPNGWSTPFRDDGAQGVRYDAETGLYWMTVRAYDPALGRFLSHDPLGRLAALGLDTQPYVYAGNNPVNWTDPSGMLFIGSPNHGGGGGKTPSKAPTGTNTTHPTKPPKSGGSGGSGGKHPATQLPQDGCPSSFFDPTPTPNPNCPVSMCGAFPPTPTPPPTPQPPTPQPPQPPPPTSGWCSPAGHLEKHLWGVSIYMNQCLAFVVGGAANVGAGIAALIATIPAAAIYAGIISSVLWIQSGEILFWAGLCSKGVYLNITILGNVFSTPACW
jgi:RHS repeat-associated protein